MLKWLRMPMGCPSPSVETAGLLVSCLFFQHTFCPNIVAFIISPPTINLGFISISLSCPSCVSRAPGCTLPVCSRAWLGLSIAYGLVVKGKCCGQAHSAESALPSLGLALSEEASLVLAPATACTHLLLFQKTCVQFPASMY